MGLRGSISSNGRASVPRRDIPGSHSNSRVNIRESRFSASDDHENPTLQHPFHSASLDDFFVKSLGGIIVMYFVSPSVPIP